MNIIRLLKLYKQHYLKSYHVMAQKEYLCWGYFDCMSVELVENRKNQGLLMTKGNVNMTDLWYASAESAKELSGHYGQQSIGMFRYEDEQSDIRDAEFWREEKRSIILAACMIRMADYSCIEKNMVEIEKIVLNASQCADCDLQGITYRTFDNSDIIVFLKGNQYIRIAELIAKLGREEDVGYVYSVCGIAKKYLDSVTDDKQINDILYNGKRLVNDAVAEVRLEIVSDGKANFNMLSMDLDNAKHTGIMGGVNNTICIKDTDMWHVVCLLRNGEGGITHGNPEFGRGIYNISTVILPEWKTINYNRGVSVVSEETEIPSWCLKKIEELKNYKNVFGECKNEILYSNWLALIRALNVLSQYENLVFSKDIFRIIFPSFKLMCYKYESVLQCYAGNVFTNDEYNKVLEIEKYINKVDGMMQHLTHTSQTFLSVPGYSGSFYDIPTKLLLLYMAYAYQLVEIFNDSEKKFYCYICPLLNSKPEVEKMESEGQKEKEILLNIQLAQRHLYMPRAFIVILTHEIFHYVSEKSRCRQERASHLIIMCIYAVVYQLFSDSDKDGVREENINRFVEDKQCQVQDFLARTIPDVVRKNSADKENIYGSETLTLLLIESIYQILNEPKLGLEEVIRELPFQQHQGSKNDVKKNLSDWSGILRNVEECRKKMLAENMLAEIVEKFMYNFREIYADLSSIICLKLDLKYYLEAILVSEGMMLDEKFDSIIVINRLAVVIYALISYTNVKASLLWKVQWEILSQNKRFPLKGLVRKVDAYMKQMTNAADKSMDVEYNAGMEHSYDIWACFYLDGVWEEQVKYAKECINQLSKNYFNHQEAKGHIRQIREVFDLFKMYNVNKDRPYRELFESYDKLTVKYNAEIDKMINDEIKKMMHDEEN